MGKELETSEGYLEGVESQFPELSLLRTIPGIGPLLAPVIWSERRGTFTEQLSANELPAVCDSSHRRVIGITDSGRATGG